jgi:GPH family glycoside/pentoside/hexuronide:cation symporter
MLLMILGFWYHHIKKERGNMKTFRFKALDKPIFDSRIKTSDIKNKERWLGYFLGPALVATVAGAVGGSYLNSFYTDVLHMNTIAGGAFLALMPLISKILDAITNLIMGQIVENTKTRQGKARPWILLSGPMLLISMILLFTVPDGTNFVRAAWVIVSYNLYFSVSLTIYNLSNVVTVPVSTRDGKQRDSLAVVQSAGISMVSGVILAVVVPSFVLPYIGVDQGRWIKAMSIISIFAIIGTLVQYFFIKERVTEEVSEEKMAADRSTSLMDQLRGCFSDKYWLLAISVLLIQNICSTAVGVNSVLYYANWVVGTYNDGKTMTFLNMIGQFLLGPGLLVVWPLIKKFGKQKVFLICGIIASIVGTIGMMFATNLTMALIALTIRSIGNIPYTYVLLSVIADALDHVEWKCGYRCDGFSSSVYSTLLTVVGGLGMGIINIGLTATGYVPPAADGSWVVQSDAVKGFLTFCMFGLPAIGTVINTVLFFFMNLEKKLPEIHAQLAERRAAQKGELL